jgi:hypothetical protein
MGRVLILLHLGNIITKTNKKKEKLLYLLFPTTVAGTPDLFNKNATS